MLKFKELDDKKKRLIIIVSVLVVFIGVTLAYVVGQISDGAIGNANVTADTTDNLQFSVDKDISLNPTQFNVTEGGGGLSDTAVGTATLLANSTNETATYDYYVYFNIKSNDYTYTTEDYKPEIVLTITDPEGNPVTKLANSDLEYVEAENADGTITKGFDITTASGLINIASLYEITSNSSTDATEQGWTFTVTFINLTTNQTENGGKTLNAEIILSKDVTNYHEICEPGTMACDIARLYNEENPESNGLYYHNGGIKGEVCMYDGNEVSSLLTDTSISVESCNQVYLVYGSYFGGEIINDGIELGIVEEIIWDSTNGICETTSGIPVSNDLETATSQEQCIGYALIQGEYAFLMVNVGSGTIEHPILDAEDRSYRYSGANPNNYVCFGSDEETCPTDNLYRIIGVFDGQVKLIKADYTTSEMLGTDGDYYGIYAGSTSYYKGNMDTSTIVEYSWNNDTSVSDYGLNNWETSEFNKINLNTNYWNYLGSDWQNLIAITTWQVGGNTFRNISGTTPKNIYANEIINPAINITYTDEIGLMYVSDFKYATSLEAWNTSVDKSNNWMYMGLLEWTITRNSEHNNHVFYFGTGSVVSIGSVVAYVGNVARPVFYLKPSVELAGGTGTQTDPYRLEI